MAATIAGGLTVSMLVTLVLSATRLCNLVHARRAHMAEQVATEERSARMKAVWILHDIVLTDEIQDLLDELGVVGFSRWKRMTGRGPQAARGLDNPVWPGANSGRSSWWPTASRRGCWGACRRCATRSVSKPAFERSTTPVLEALVSGAP